MNELIEIIDVKKRIQTIYPRKKDKIHNKRTFNKHQQIRNSKIKKIVYVLYYFCVKRKLIIFIDEKNHIHNH